MGTNLPPKRGAAVNWILARMSMWSTSAAQIGLDEAEVSSLQTLAGTAQSARTAAAAARTESKNKTRDWHDKADAAMDEARELILKIKAFAASSGDPQVWVLSGLSPRDEPGETPAPDVPSDIKAELLNQGYVRLTWKGKGPRGTFYIVKRRLDNEAKFTVIATVTDKAFTDEDLPFGTDKATYAIDAQQTDKRVYGPEKAVQLGVGNNQQAQQAQQGQQGGGQGVA